MDPLSHILSLLRPVSSLSAGLDAGGDWAIHFPEHEGIKFNAVMRGSCWVSIDGDPEPHRIEEGDCFLLTKGRPFTFATDLSLEAIDPSCVYDNAQDGVATCNGGGDFFLIGGRFTFANAQAEILFDAMPSFLYVSRASSHASVLRWALQHLAAELRSPQMGGFLISEHLAHVMLVQVLRIYASEQQGAGAGWFRALGDRQLSRVMGAMHADPAHRWTLRELASIAGMSRSAFAREFRRVVGASPLDYLTRWRMLAAGDHLQNSKDSIASVAVSVGYESENAFSTAFRRIMLCSPRQYRRGMNIRPTPT